MMKATIKYYIKFSCLLIWSVISISIRFSPFKYWKWTPTHFSFKDFHKSWIIAPDLETGDAPMVVSHIHKEHASSNMANKANSVHSFFLSNLYTARTFFSLALEKARFAFDILVPIAFIRSRSLSNRFRCPNHCLCSVRRFYHIRCPLINQVIFSIMSWLIESLNHVTNVGFTAE